MKRRKVDVAALPAKVGVELDDEGYLVAKSDYTEPVGPGFWERP